MSPLRLAVLAAASPALPALAAPLPVCPVHNGQQAEYDIVRGGNVIGRQTVRYTVAGPDMTVTIDMTAELRAVGIRVYHYQHHGEEHWHDGQMTALATQTDDDGTPRRVDATRDASATWHGVQGQAGAAPLLATSLWNSQTASQTRLLDRETGQVTTVRAAPAVDEVVSLGGGRQLAAHRVDMAGQVSGSAWYGPDGCWVRALFHTRVDGSLVEVRAR